MMYECNMLRYTIKDLDLHGTEMAYVPFEEFGIMRNLRTVGIAKTRGKLMNMQGKCCFIDGISKLRRCSIDSFILRKSVFVPIYNFLTSEPSAEQDLSGSNIVQSITFQEFAPGLEHLDLVNSGIREIDKVLSNKRNL